MVTLAQSLPKHVNFRTSANAKLTSNSFKTAKLHLYLLVQCQQLVVGQCLRVLREHLRDSHVCCMGRDISVDLAHF